MNAKIKASVYLPDDVHRRLKHVSVERRTSIQSLMEEITEAYLDAKDGAQGSTEPALRPKSAKEMRDWFARLKYVFESGNDLAILNCTATIRAMELWVEEGKKAAGGVTPIDQAGRSAIKADQEAASQRKTGP